MKAIDYAACENAHQQWQQEQIKKIQSSYAEKIAKLNAEMEAKINAVIEKPVIYK